MSKFESLPVEVIIDNILPFLPVSAVANLSATNKFFYLVTSDETFWRRRLLVDYNFSGNDTARTTGWKFIYRRLANPKVYVWGENSKRRLGFRPRDLPQTSVYEGVPYPVQLHLPHGVKVVSLCAGGMSFHALDSQGRIWVWGTLDGTGFFVHAENFSDRYKPAEAPTLLELPFSIRAISCGRLHAAALTTSSQVLNFPSWGRPFVLHSRYFTSSLSYLSPSADIHSSFTNPTASIIHAHSPPSVPIQVECGWGFTAVLTSSGNVFVYWPRENGRDRLGRLIYKMNRKWDEESVGMAKLEGVHGDHEDPLRTKCHVWNVDAETPNDSYRDDEGHEIQEEGVIMLKLPDLEGYDLPKLTNMKGQSGESDTDEPVKIVKIAGLDNTIVGLTNNGHVVMIRGLEDQETSQLAGNRWTYLPYFSEVEKVREDDVWTEGSNGLQPPKEMKISHISGNYKTFTAYSPHPGVVLMGNIDDDPSINHPNISNSLLHARPFKPNVLPDLQAPRGNIISVVLGDYHFGALTSSGRLLTWGEFSKGALGLGDPNDLDVGVPGGFRNQEEKDESIRNTSLRRNGLEPDRTDVPGEVRFDWEDKKRGREGKERYCFGATAAGWHMGALVIDLSPDGDASDIEEHPEARIPGAFPTQNPPTSHDNDVPSLGRGINPFRIGFAGRGGHGGPPRTYRPLG